MVRIPYVAPQRIIVHVRASHAFLAASLVVLRSCGSGSREGAARAAGPEGEVLHTYNWADCIGESKIAECGVAMLDSAGDVFSLERLYLGLDVNSESTADPEAVEAVFTRVRPDVRHFDSSRYISDLANDQFCVAPDWSGGVLQARSRGKARRSGST